MATAQEAVQQLLERALSDPAYLQQVMADPLGTARAAGIRVTTADLKRWLHLPEGTTDAELLELLRARLGPLGGVPSASSADRGADS